MSRTKIIQTGLRALCERWPMVKNWSTLPNDVLYQIGLAVIESESRESWGKPVYLSREIDQIIDNRLEYNEDLYYTRTGKGFVYDDGAHAQYGELSSIMTLNN
jgi:hypothetical protein